MAKKIDSFILENIQKRGNRIIVLTVRNGKLLERFPASIKNGHSVSFPDRLEVLMMQPEFNFHKEFLKIISDFNNGAKIQFPIVLFDKQKERLQAA